MTDLADLLTRAGLPSDTPVRLLNFGSDPAMVDRILAAIAGGDKTGTFSLAWLHERGLAEPPVVGGYCAPVTAAGEPVQLLRTTGVETVPFDAIGPEHTALDGPAIRELPVWRDVHWAFFGNVLEAAGLAPSGEMPVVVERFEPVTPAS
ncbi:MAG: ASCH domain-containing protein [Pseudomonadota bacterium]